MLKQGIQKFLSVFGYKLVSTDGMPCPDDGTPGSWTLQIFFPLLKKFGFEPRHIWDIGANRGNWTRMAIRFFPHSEYTLVEPQDSLKENLEDLVQSGHKIRWINAGAGDQPQVLPFYVAPQDPGSTFLELPRITREAVQCVDVPMRTLNEVLATLSLPIPEMLKVDAEGLDLKVLKGATDLLGNTEIVLIEVSIGQLDFENTAGAVIQAMDKYGYRLIDITDLNRSPTHGLLWLCEFAFLLKSSHLMERASRY